jgi:hypothetical protein
MRRSGTLVALFSCTRSPRPLSAFKGANVNQLKSLWQDGPPTPNPWARDHFSPLFDGAKPGNAWPHTTTDERSKQWDGSRISATKLSLPRTHGMHTAALLLLFPYICTKIAKGALEHLISITIEGQYHVLIFHLCVDADRRSCINRHVLLFPI